MKQAPLVALLLAGLVPALRAQCVQAGKLLPPLPDVDREFGTSVATDGDLLVVGAPKSMLFDDLHLEGAAAVFRREADTWTLEAHLTAPDPLNADDFGRSVAISGDTVVIGAPHKDQVIYQETGAAYVFVRSDGSWPLQATLHATPPTYNLPFGGHVTIEGDLCVVSTTWEFGNGVVRVFRRNGTTWTQVQKLTEPTLTNVALYGTGLELRGGELFVGAPYDGEAPQSAGHVFDYTWNGTSFVLQQTLISDDIQPGDRFGSAVARDGDLLLIGAPGRNTGGVEDSGGAYVFRRNGAQWVQDATLETADPDKLGNFGLSVALRGTLLAVGEPGDWFSTDTTTNGAVWRYDPAGPQQWVHGPKFMALDNGELERFGTSVAVRGDAILSGTPFDVDPWPGLGAVYELTGVSPWSNLGDALGGSTGLPRLWGAGSPLAGETISLLVQQAAIGAASTLVLGASAIDAPFKGGVLVPAPNVIVPALIIGDGGKLCIEGVLGSSLPPGTLIDMQAWIPDSHGPHGFAATNAIQLVAP